MKIGLSHKRLDLQGGTEKDFHRTAEGLRDLGHDVHLFCQEARVRLRFHRLPSPPLGRTVKLLSFALAAPRAVAAHRCDVTVGFGRAADHDIVRSGGGTHRVFLAKMGESEGLARRAWHRISPYHRCALAVEKRQFGFGSYRRVLAVSQEVKREIAEQYGVPETKIAVVYNGVDQVRFDPRNREKDLPRIRRQWGIPATAPMVLFVGHGFRRKGLDRLLGAWASPRLADAYLVVAGADAQQWRYAAAAAKSSAGRIIFAGPQADIESYYAAADLFALPAIQEAFGNVVLEALASGLPVLTTRGVGAAELLTGDLTEGILSRPDDPVEVAEKILRLIERRPILSSQARRIGESHSWKNHFRELEGYLVETAEERRRGAAA
jgi:UDP-glucose:(heptosyl)LPS alpha-1,3-glucosyltransferase